MDTPTAANPKGPVVVTGAAGYIGSCLVGTLLRRGYAVRATVRDPTNLKRLKPLLDLRPEQTSEARYVDDGRLSIWRGVLGEEGSFDDAVRGCTAVFHVATVGNICE